MTFNFSYSLAFPAGGTFLSTGQGLYAPCEKRGPPLVMGVIAESMPGHRAIPFESGQNALRFLRPRPGLFRHPDYYSIPILIKMTRYRKLSNG